MLLLVNLASTRMHWRLTVPLTLSCTKNKLYASMNMVLAPKLPPCPRSCPYLTPLPFVRLPPRLGSARSHSLRMAEDQEKRPEDGLALQCTLCLPSCEDYHDARSILTSCRIGSESLSISYSLYGGPDTA